MIFFMCFFFYSCLYVFGFFCGGWDGRGKVVVLKGLYGGIRFLGWLDEWGFFYDVNNIRVGRIYIMV